MSITDRIRKQMVQPDGLVAEQLSPLAEEYGQETAAVNARLQECIVLLRRGLRSEAIQRATMKPDVLDWSARLDFPELEDWLSILQFYGIRAPELLDRDAAQQIQEGMVEVQSLDQLLRQHRRLAIAKAPLSWRLKVLRSLAEADHANLVWREDQEQWERVRVKQLPQEIKEAAEQRNVVAIRNLASEINESQWVINRPLDLGKRVNGLLDGYVYEDQVVQLREIADKLHAAYGENNQQAASEHRLQWNRLSRLLKRPVPDDLADNVAPAFAWLDDRKLEEQTAREHDAARAALDAVLQRGGSIDEIERASQSLSRLQPEDDSDLLEHARTRIKSMQAAQSRNKMIKMVSSLVAVIAIIGAISWWQLNRSFRSAVGDSISRLSALLHEKKLEDAEALLAKLKRDAPAVAASPAMATVIAQIDRNRQQEDERSQRALKIIAQAKQDDPANIDILKVVEAERVAVTAAEKEAIQSVRSALEAHDRKIADEQFAAIEKELSTFAAKLAGFAKIAAHEIPVSELEAITVEIKKLEGDYPKGSTQAAKLITDTIQQVNGLVSNVNSSKQLISKRQSALKLIRESENLDDYTASIDQYVETMPADDSLTKSLVEIKNEAKLWKNIDAWNDFVSDLRNALDNKLAVKDFDKLQKSAQTLQSKFDTKLTQEQVDQLQDLGGGIAARSQELSSVVEELQNSIVGEMVTVLEARGASGMEGKRLFMNYDTRMQYAQDIGALRDTSNLSLPVIGDALGAVTQHRFKGKLTVIEEPRSTIKKIISRLEKDRDAFLSDWETQMNDTMKDLLDNNRLDTSLKELFLSRLVRAVRAGSPMMKDAYEELEQELNDTSARRDLWFLETDFKTTVEAKLSQLLQTSIQASSNIGSKAATQKLAELATHRFVWVGAVLPDDAGKAVPWYYRTDIPYGSVFTMRPTNKTATQFELQTVSNVQRGKLQTTVSPMQLKIGRPLFWMLEK